MRSWYLNKARHALGGTPAGTVPWFDPHARCWRYYPLLWTHLIDHQLNTLRNFFIAAREHRHELPLDPAEKGIPGGLNHKNYDVTKMTCMHHKPVLFIRLASFTPWTPTCIKKGKVARH